MPAARPAPASSHMPSNASSQQSRQHAVNAPSSGQPSKGRKRAKQAAGAGTVLLALFSFIVFLGPLGPLGGAGLSRTAPALGHLASSQDLPASQAMDHHHVGGGRVLMAVPTNKSDGLDSPLTDDQSALVLPVNSSLFDQALITATSTGDSVVNESLSGQGQVIRQAWWPSMLVAAHVEPSKSIVLRPSNKKVESEALQGLKVTTESALLVTCQRCMLLMHVNICMPTFGLCTELKRILRLQIIGGLVIAVPVGVIQAYVTLRTACIHVCIVLLTHTVLLHPADLSSHYQGDAVRALT